MLESTSHHKNIAANPSRCPTPGVSAKNAFEANAGKMSKDAARHPKISALDALSPARARVRVNRKLMEQAEQWNTLPKADP